MQATEQAAAAAPNASASWSLGWLWAAVGLEPQPEPEPEPERALDEEGASPTSGAGLAAAALAPQALPGVGDRAEQAEQLLVRFVGDWDVGGSDATSGFLSLDEQQDDDETAAGKKKLVGEARTQATSTYHYSMSGTPLMGCLCFQLQLGDAGEAGSCFEVYGEALVSVSNASVTLRVACGELQHVSAQAPPTIRVISWGTASRHGSKHEIV